LTQDSGSQGARAAKSRMRRHANACIGAMSAAGRSRANADICAGLAQLAAEEETALVLGYLSLADEVNVDSFLAEMVERGRETLLPRVVANDGLRYGQWRPSAKISRDDMGVLAPVSALSGEWFRGPSLVLVPGRVFDVAGGRVGRGGGYYDRILGARPGLCVVVGVAYECQVVDAAPREAHDRDVDCLVTETGCRRFRRGDDR